MGRRIQRTSSQDLKKLLLTPTGGRFFRPLDSFDEVFPGILLGDASTALSTCLLKELKVTHVLNAAYGKNDEYYGGFVNTSFANYDHAGIKFMGIPALDTPSFYLRSYFRQAADFIEEALRSRGKVLIHCQCGISRSATLIAAYLMLKKGMDAQEALSTIRAHRSIFPNQGFISQLCDFEYEQKRAGSLKDTQRSVSPEFEKPLRDQTFSPIFHPDRRAMFSSTNYWPLSRPVTKSGYPISSGYWDYDTESRSRARSLDRYPNSYRARSSSPVPSYYETRPYRSVSVGPTTTSLKTIETRATSPVLSSYDVTRPWYRSNYYIRTNPDSLADRIWTKPYYDSYYTYSPRYYYSSSDYYPYLSPYYSRYSYSRYYSPLSDSYYSRYPYGTSYTPLSLRYPYLYSRYYY